MSETDVTSASMPATPEPATTDDYEAAQWPDPMPLRDVPTELIVCGTRHVEDWFRGGAVEYEDDDVIGVILAAVLPLHEQQLRAERDAATARAEKAEAALATLHAVIENMHKHDREQREGRRQAETALARLRTQLGESRIEWGVQHPLYGTDYIQGADNARAQCGQLNAGETGRPWRVVTRLAGQWRSENEPDATRLERYDDAPRTALERVADEQGAPPARRRGV